VPLSTDEIYAKAMKMAKNVEDNFLDLGRYLRQLQNRDPEKFQEIIQKTDLKRRKAYYLVEVSKTFDPLPVFRARLKKLGWTKCQIIGKHVTKDNVEELVTLAENMPIKLLEKHMRGENPVPGSHCVLMYFSPEPYEDFEEALIAHGAKPNPPGAKEGPRGKEAALMRIICQSASKSDPRSASKIDPLVRGADGSARPGGAGRGCAAGASAGRRGAVVLEEPARLAPALGAESGRCAGQSRPKPRDGTMAWSSVRSRSQIARNASAVALSCRLSGRASSQAAY